MSTTALAAVVAKLTGLSIAGKAAVGIAVAAGCVVAAPAVAHQVAEAPAPADTAVVEPVDPGTTDPIDATDPTDPTGDQDQDQVRDEDCDTDGDGVVDQDQDGDQTQDQVCDLDQTQDRDRDGELPEAASFGQGVAADARDGGVDGQQVRELAHERNELRHGDDTVPEVPAEDITEGTPDDTTDTGSVDAPGPQAPVAPAGHGRRP